MEKLLIECALASRDGATSRPGQALTSGEGREPGGDQPPGFLFPSGRHIAPSGVNSWSLTIPAGGRMGLPHAGTSA